MNAGIAAVPSPYSFSETVLRFEKLLASKGVKVFATIDQAREAESAGLALRPTVLILFGNPKAGTPVMAAAPTSPLDLPLKVLISEDDGGKVWVTYNTPAYLEQRHGIPPSLIGNIAVIETLVAKALE